VTPVGLHDLLVDLSATSIVVAGLATDVCVLATVLDACRLGYDVTVVDEASAGIDCDGSLSRAWAQMTAAAARRAATVTEAASSLRRG
ncbi:MAG: isochorismatase family protein, partial [Pirellulales bacterium]|nr:isochorismatase family protein [Pirellulales bacterium]